MTASIHTTDSGDVDSESSERVRLLTVIGAGLVFASGLIHLWLVPEHLAEATYLGELFAVDFVLATVAAVGIYRNRRWGWLLGVALAAGAILLYVAHVTVGLPVVGVEEPFEPVGVGTKLVELLYLGVAVVWIRSIG